MPRYYNDGETLVQAKARIDREGRWPWYEGLREILLRDIMYNNPSWKKTKATVRSSELAVMFYPPVPPLTTWRPSRFDPVGGAYRRSALTLRKLVNAHGGWREEIPEQPKRKRAMVYTDVMGHHDIKADRLWVYNNLNNPIDEIKSAPNQGAYETLTMIQKDPAFKMRFIMDIFKPVAKTPLGAKNEAMEKECDQALMETFNTLEQIAVEAEYGKQEILEEETAVDEVTPTAPDLETEDGEDYLS